MFVCVFLFFYFSLSIRALFPFRITQRKKISEFLCASIELTTNKKNETKRNTEQQQQIIIYLTHRLNLCNIWYDTAVYQ